MVTMGSTIAQLFAVAQMLILFVISVLVIWALIKYIRSK